MSYLEEWDDAKLDRLIHIIGNNSAAFKAKRDREDRRGRGEDAHVWLDVYSNTFVVGPPLIDSRQPETKETP